MAEKLNFAEPIERIEPIIPIKHLQLHFRRFEMPFWQRLVFTIIVIVVASLVAGLAWHRLFGFSLPSYVGGVIGGLTAVPFWELLKRKGSKEK